MGLEYSRVGVFIVPTFHLLFYKAMMSESFVAFKNKKWKTIIWFNHFAYKVNSSYCNLLQFTYIYIKIYICFRVFRHAHVLFDLTMKSYKGHCLQGLVLVAIKCKYRNTVSIPKWISTRNEVYQWTNTPWGIDQSPITVCI